jgi:RloB-like protein
MVSNSRFQRRKAHRTSSFSRRIRQNLQRPCYLIVCEGSATEPYYFSGLKNHERLPTAHLKICGEECGSDPMSVVTYALQIYEEEKEDRFDAIFCVIDRDGHANFKAAVARIEDLKATGTPIEVFVSWPCFEYWVLLHHCYTRATYCSPRQGLSACDAVESEIRRKHDRSYAKADRSLYTRLKPRQTDALRNAARAKADADLTGEPNPSTDVHSLVSRLLALVDPIRAGADDLAVQLK